MRRRGGAVQGRFCRQDGSVLLNERNVNIMKLVLNKKTLASLTAAEMNQVAGGYATQACPGTHGTTGCQTSSEPCGGTCQTCEPSSIVTCQQN